MGNICSFNTLYLKKITLPKHVTITLRYQILLILVLRLFFFVYDSSLFALLSKFITITTAAKKYFVINNH